MYNFSEFKNNLNEVKLWLEKEFLAIRTGRATTSLLEGIFVEAYGSKMPLNQVATISNEDAKTLKINPFDQAQAKNIEKAINDADLGVSVAVSDSGIRVIFPDLTSERREMLIKQAKKKLEESKISLRSERDDVWNDIQTKQKNGELTEDDKFRLKEEMQKLFDEIQKALDEMFDRKEQEIKN